MLQQAGGIDDAFAQDQFACGFIGIAGIQALSVFQVIVPAITLVGDMSKIEAYNFIILVFQGKAKRILAENSISRITRAADLPLIKQQAVFQSLSDQLLATACAVVGLSAIVADLGLLAVQSPLGDIVLGWLTASYGVFKVAE